MNQGQIAPSHAFKRAEISSPKVIRECLTIIKDLRKRRALVMAEMEKFAESVLAREIEPAAGILFRTEPNVSTVWSQHPFQRA